MRARVRERAGKIGQMKKRWREAVWRAGDKRFAPARARAHEDKTKDVDTRFDVAPACHITSRHATGEEMRDSFPASGSMQGSRRLCRFFVLFSFLPSLPCSSLLFWRHARVCVCIMRARPPLHTSASRLASPRLASQTSLLETLPTDDA